MSNENLEIQENSAAAEQSAEIEQDRYFNFLYELRDSGKTNMFDAIPYLLEAFLELDKQSAIIVLSDWMASFTKETK